MSDRLFSDAHYRELSTWPIRKVRAYADHPGHQGQHLEAVRELAQAHAYWDDDSTESRLEWAKLSLRVIERMHGDDPWQKTNRATQNFMLRTWVIANLGPDPADADWAPDTLATDTLAALSLDPDQARDLGRRWQDLPIDQIAELRRHKNLTRHLPTLLDHLHPGPLRDLLHHWTETRQHLP